MNDRWLVLALTTLITSGATVLAVESAPVLVDAAYQNRHWSTVYTNAVLLTWDWNTNAAHAVLDITGMNGSSSTNFTEVTTNFLWHPFASDAPTAEDVYELTLAFYTGAEVNVGAITSRLAVITGSFGQAAVDPVETSRQWGLIKSNAVLSYEPAYAEAATNAVAAQLVIAKVDGATQTNVFTGTAGYFGWKIKNNGWGYGTFDLALTFPETPADVLTAELMRPLDGTAISIR